MNGVRPTLMYNDVTLSCVNNSNYNGLLVFNNVVCISLSGNKGGGLKQSAWERNKLAFCHTL